MKMRVYSESWPIKGQFTISRGSKTEAQVVVVELCEGNKRLGWGEAVPYKHYKESVEESIALLNAIMPSVDHIDRNTLMKLMQPSAARNALDCALWDYEAKQVKKNVWELAGLPEPKPVQTAYTISFNSAAEMAKDAKLNQHRPLLKLKLANADDFDRVLAVRKAAPNSTLIVDANEGWTISILEDLAPKLADLGVALIEQPLRAEEDEVLEGRQFAVPLCADESCRLIEDLPKLAQKYSYINIKLDKTGGLTHALEFVKKAEDLNLKLMIGCMVSTSLSMAPASLLAPFAEFIDLDGPLLLREDRKGGMLFQGSLLNPPSSEFWG